MMPPRVLASGPKPCGGNKQLLDEVEHDIMNSIIVLLYIYTYNSSSETEAKRPAILFLR